MAEVTVGVVSPEKLFPARCERTFR